jgi:4-nitrophenyl phosphatase
MESQPKKIKAVLLDMDGVLWRGSEPLVKIGALVEGFKNLGCRVCCVTNNSTQTVAQYQQRLAKFEAKIEANLIITSAEATAAYLSDHYPSGAKVFILGEDGLRTTIRQAGFDVVREKEDLGVRAAVVGLDRDFHYQDVNQAVQYIQRGAAFIGTNPDRTIPTPSGPAPGAGAIIKMIEASTGLDAVMIGKPAEHLYQLALSRAGSSPAETLMIGDRLETDISGAQNLNIRTGLVLTGIASKAEAEAWVPQPDIIAEDALQILEVLTANDGKLI